MKHVNPFPFLMSLLCCIATSGLRAQQTVPQSSHLVTGINRYTLDSLVIVDGTYDMPCADLIAVCINGTLPLETELNEDLHGAFTIQRGNGMKSINVRIYYRSDVFLEIDDLNYAWRTDGGNFNETGSITLNGHLPSGQLGGFYKFMDDLTISYSAGDTTDNDLFHVFSIKPGVPGTGPLEIRFKAVMVGASVSQPLGYFDTPALPLYILHDPPGDMSWASVSSNDQTCLSNGLSISTSNSVSGFLKAKIGVSATIGWIVESELETYIQGGISVESSQERNTDMDMSTCISSESGYTTATTGVPQDLFIGRAMRYLYGVGTVVTRPTCNSVKKDTVFVSVPIATLSTYSKSELEIRNNVIPELQDTLDILLQTVGVDDTLYHRKTRALEAWQNALALNDSIKEAAVGNSPLTWTGVSSGTFDHSQSLSSATRRSIQFKTTLSTGLSAEYALHFGGSGVDVGGEVTFRSEVGSSEGSEAGQGQTRSYHLEDDDLSDQFTVSTAVDSTYGTFVFALDSNISRTSCPYEGGYQLDQPQLWVGQMNQDHMTQTNLLSGSTADFPIYACNNSNIERTYKLQLVSQSNPNGAIISGYNGITSSSSVLLTLPANACDVAVGHIYLTQPITTTLDFENIQLILSPECDEDDGINSLVTITAHFDISAGIPGFSDNGSVTVRPNPSVGLFDLMLPQNTHDALVRVTDALGRTVLEPTYSVGRRLISLDLGHATPGTYFLSVVTDTDQQMIRLMLER